MLLLGHPLLAHHFTPQFVTVTCTLLSLIAHGGEVGAGVSSASGAFSPHFGGAMATGLHGRGAPFPGCSSTLASTLTVSFWLCFSLLIFGPEVSFQNSSRAWK